MTAMVDSEARVRAIAAHDSGAHSAIRTPGCPKCNDVLAVHHEQGLHEGHRVSDCAKCYPARRVLPTPPVANAAPIALPPEMSERLHALTKALRSTEPATRKRAKTILTKMDELIAVNAEHARIEAKRTELAALRKQQTTLLAKIAALQDEIRALSGTKRPGRRAKASEAAPHPSDAYLGKPHGAQR